MKDSLITQYFEKRGIATQVNTLGHSAELIRAYVSDTQEIVNAATNECSHYVKHECYSLYYEMDTRPKLTGFEAFESASRRFRITQAASPEIELQWSPTLPVEKVVTPTDRIYKQVLKDSFAAYSKPLFLYLSGGIDSELVALALLDANIPFTPIIFNWANNLGEIQNLVDTSYASKFCEVHSLSPIVKTVNIDELWASYEFKKLSDDAQLISAHLVTHVYMISIINAEYPNHQHLMGGEIRYRSSYIDRDGTMVNLVNLDKVAAGSLGYSGGGYVSYATGGIYTSNQFSLRYNGSTGIWDLTRTNANYSDPGMSGTWTTTPGSSYEYQIYSVSGTVFYGGGSCNPAANQTGWTGIASGKILCSVSVPTTNNSTPADSTATFGIYVRDVAPTYATITSSIQLSTVNGI